MTLNPVNDELVLALQKVIPQTCFLPLSAKYLEEPRGIFTGVGGLLLAPNSTRDVSEIIKLCNHFEVGIIPYGGGTGLVGGQVAEDVPAPVILSLERMNKIRSIETADNTIIVEAGVTLAGIQETADDADRLFPLSLASEGSCQIGGNLSTNAGGVGVLRYGNARDLCLGLEAVLPDGSIWNGLKRLRKDNTGYDLKNLIIGAEGSLGIITAASLKLYPKPQYFVTGFLQIRDPDAALELLEKCQTILGGMISACELIHHQGVAFLRETLPQVRIPFAQDAEWMLLLEAGVTGDFDANAALENLLAEGFESGLVTDALMAQNEAQRQDFWALRETIPAANRLIGAIYSHDISVPVGKIPEFIHRANQAVARLGDFRVNCFGHVGDGNLHFNIFPPKGRERSEYQDHKDAIKSAVYVLVDELGGSVSAEHGIGRLKRDDLQRYSDPTKLAAMRSIKTALDPKGIMNPGAVLPR